MERKYELTEETIIHEGATLHRIKALLDFGGVEAGDLGGYIEGERNLSHYGNCWVGGNAIVWDNALVGGNAIVYGDAQIYGDARVSGNAIVSGDARVYGEAQVSGKARVSGDARVYGEAQVSGEAMVYGKAMVYGEAQVSGEAMVYGEAQVSGDARVGTIQDYIVFKNWWSSGRCFTWTRSNNMWRVGCFYGTGGELVAKAYKDSEESGKRYAEIVDYVNRCVLGE